MSICNCQLSQKPTVVPRVYQRRQPERTAAYQIVQNHLETWSNITREAHPDENPAPSYVGHYLRKFLECGILAHGLYAAKSHSSSLVSSDG